jgi:hypothetical protein
MKKLLLILLASPLLSMAQSRIGYTEAEIRSEFSEFTFETRFRESGEKFIVTNMVLGVMYYYFDESGHCYSCYLLPKKEKLHAIIEKYNRDFTIISDTRWKFYGADMIIDINMIFNQDFKSYVFVFKPLTN